MDSEVVGDPAAALGSATHKNRWLLGPSNELLLWIPAEYRSSMKISPCTNVIGRSGVMVIAESRWCFGEEWTSCWRTNSKNDAPLSLNRSPGQLAVMEDSVESIAVFDPRC